MFETKVIGKIKTHIFNNFFPENYAVYKTMWKKYGIAERSQMTI
jgi:hypothetical protein